MQQLSLEPARSCIWECTSVCTSGLTAFGSILSHLRSVLSLSIKLACLQTAGHLPSIFCQLNAKNRRPGIPGLPRTGNKSTATKLIKIKIIWKITSHCQKNDKKLWKKFDVNNQTFYQLKYLSIIFITGKIWLLFIQEIFIKTLL